MAQRLDTTAGTPAAKKALASDEVPSVAESLPSAVLQPDRMASRIRVRFQPAIADENTAPELLPSDANTRWDICGASCAAIACPAKWRISAAGAIRSSAASVAFVPMRRL